MSVQALAALNFENKTYDDYRRDSALLARLRTAMGNDGNEPTTIVNRINNVFAAHDVYIRYGPSGRPGSRVVPIDVIDCGKALLAINASATIYIHQQKSLAPRARQAHFIPENMSRVLLDLLRRVLERPQDAYANIAWTRDPHSMQMGPREHDLVVNLISGRPSSKRRAFVVEALAFLHYDVSGSAGLSRSADGVLQLMRRRRISGTYVDEFKEAVGKD